MRGMMLVAPLQKMAERHGWWMLDHQQNIGMISFLKGTARINVYYSRMTVTTVVDHPKLGRNSLYRKGVDMGTMEKIFINPRSHVGLGYHQRSANHA